MDEILIKPSKRLTGEFHHDLIKACSYPYSDFLKKNDFIRTHLPMTSSRVPGQVSMDDTEGFLVIGGMEGRPAFKGYVGQATYFRNKIVSSTQVILPSFTFKECSIDKNLMN